ncbi:MAG: YihY/virulence factor BrkB family protein [Selenomonadaceae bacterium]|nr:YihY/virulence factor BrkB family protein [Selenomonadaceae bacterium]
MLVRKLVNLTQRGLKTCYFFGKGMQYYLKTDELHGLSPGIAFYFIIGFIPFLVFIANVLLFFTVAQLDNVIAMLYSYFPERIAVTLEGDIQRIVNQRSDIWMWMGLMAATISFEQGLEILVHATDRIGYRNTPEEDRAQDKYKTYYVKGKSVLLAVGLVLTIILSLGLTVFGNMVVELLGQSFSLPAIFLDTWYLVQFFLPFVVLIMFLTVFYWSAPTYIPKLWPSFLAAFCVTVLWLVATGVYSWLMMLMPGMGASYGPMLGLFVLFLWFRYIAYIIIIGIGFTKAWDKWDNMYEVFNHFTAEIREENADDDLAAKREKQITLLELKRDFADLLRRLANDESFWAVQTSREIDDKLTKFFSGAVERVEKLKCR